MSLRLGKTAYGYKLLQTKLEFDCRAEKRDALYCRPKNKATTYHCLNPSSRENIELHTSRLESGAVKQPLSDELDRRVTQGVRLLSRGHIPSKGGVSGACIVVARIVAGSIRLAVVRLIRKWGIVARRNLVEVEALEYCAVQDQINDAECCAESVARNEPGEEYEYALVEAGIFSRELHVLGSEKVAQGSKGGTMLGARGVL